MTFPLIITVPEGTDPNEITDLRQAGWFVITTDRPDLVRLITPSTAGDDGGTLLKAALHALAMPRTPGVSTPHQEQNVMLAAIHERFMAELNRQLKPRPTDAGAPAKPPAN